MLLFGSALGDSTKIINLWPPNFGFPERSIIENLLLFLCYLFVQERGGISITLNVTCGDGHGMRAAQNLEESGQKQRKHCAV